MSLPSTDSPESRAFSLDPRTAKAFLRFSGGFWRGETALAAWLLTLGLGTALIASVGVTAALNWWNRWFFDALERRDAATAGQAVLVFLAIIVAMAAIGVAIVLTRETLQVRWRAWLVGRLVGLWTGRERFFHMAAMGIEPANPEYRIADDSRWATEPLTDLAIGLLSAVVGAATFISILWVVGGSYRLEIAGSVVTIPAYMVVVALAYGAIASAAMLIVGRPLVGKVGHKNAAEGYFRFALTRLRESSEAVALMRGGAGERAILAESYDTVVRRWLAIVRSHGHLTWITNSSGPMIPVVPLLFAAPKYLAGEMTLGQVTQLAAAFVQVQMAISWIVDNYSRIAEWYASARRVMDIVDACEGVDRALAGTAKGGIEVGEGRGDGLAVAGLRIAAADGSTLLEVDRLTARGGDLVHVRGDSSSGKSMLVRAIAGLWQRGSGRIELPAGRMPMIAPQRAYLPLGTLRQVLTYPDPTSTMADAALRDALATCGLARLGERLDETERWDQVLSNGERQRLTVARLLLHRPAVAILDDGLSALDEATQRQLIEALRARVPGITILTLGQRPGPRGLTTQALSLERGPVGASLRLATAEA